MRFDHELDASLPLIAIRHKAIGKFGFAWQALGGD
jgi:hypothetical protein